MAGESGTARTGIAASLGRAHLLMLAMLRGVPATVRRPRLLLEQMFSVGVLTVLIIAVSGVFVGMVLGLQGFYILSRFGAEATLGVMVAASLVRELGPGGHRLAVRRARRLGVIGRDRLDEGHRTAFRA